ncbi:MAG: prenyltransferase [Candidatus Bathyarchaeota archaeon]|nr:MAG: prenyltransferase [Candidatus Bathyarchaeota archaeon]
MQLFRLSRSHFLLLGFMLYLMGYLIAVLNGGDIALGRFTLGYLIICLAQLSVSFSNDYFDRTSDRVSRRTAFSGGSGVLIEYPELAKLALKMSRLLLALSLLTSTSFIIMFDYPLWFFGLGALGVFIGWFYTAPPLRLIHRGLGEIAVTLSVGLLIPGLGYAVACRTIDTIFFAFVFPMSCYGLLFILSVELPDVESDTIAKKTNVYVKWGRKAGKSVSLIVAIAGTTSLVAINVSGILRERIDLGLIILLSIPPIITTMNSLQEGSIHFRTLVYHMRRIIASLILLVSLGDLVLLSQYIQRIM